ncbi:sulfatase-like hydrolase/transferase [Ramlibacter sp. USB13]|uniref:Sulfatase-like hydrolase/transferase n=1 Tax=Ramlibacter cellulosilyticus TaxID=2764187 RepID=A0A923MPD6_9BURK|nr:sulfatase-like hydrolase/transferase [Ramlibacter cellulosilyticus]MBC5782760.1 sulfatase-like hydrolase/transferase [Ramlibacter cellulosilyticus]
MSPPRGTGIRRTAIAPLAWFVILILPAALTLSAAEPWDLDAGQLLLASGWSIICLRLLVPPRVFPWLTYPLALFGLACLVADLLRNVNLLELAAEWNTFNAAEVAEATAPYRWMLAGTSVGLGVLCWWAARGAGPHPLGAGVRYSAVLVGTACLAVLLPAATWPRAWPVNATLVGVAFAVNSPAVAHAASSVTLASPRNPQSSWEATRVAAPSARQTMILLIGESVRADFLRECGGPAAVRAVRAGALVACDVAAGANATHTSVPLLISREWPGYGARVSNDATFQRAFEEAGFRTYWFGTQGNSIAWPDAMVQAYPVERDPEGLLPLLDRVLASPEPASSIVLHGYGAHAPYCERFDAKASPAGAGCPIPPSGPTHADLARWRSVYAGAVDASVDFLNQVIERLERVPGEAFLVYTPDHGENLLDDRRALYGHALRHPTRWDTHVPAVFWANAAWKAAHPQAWAQLSANTRAPLMHADLVPTLLGAAQVRYRERPRPAVNLLQQPVPARQRVVQKALGAVSAWDTLVFEAGEPARRPAP